MRTLAAYVLRTNVGPWLTLLVVATEVLNLLDDGRPWLGDAVLTLEWTGSILLFVGPLVCGAIAVDTARALPPSRLHLAEAGAPARRMATAVIGSTLVPVLVIHTITFVVAVTAGGLSWTTLARTNVVAGFLVHLAVLTWFAILGYVLGRALDVVVAGFLATVGGYVLSLLLGYSGMLGGLDLLDTGGASATQVGRVVDLGSVALRLALIALSAALAVTVVWSRHGRRRRLSGRNLARLAVAFGLVAVTVVLPELPRRVDGPLPVAEACRAGEHVELCMFDEHARYADSALAAIDPLVGAARSRGYQVFAPGLVRERTATDWHDDGMALLLPPVTTFTQGSRLEPSDWIQAMLLPAHCPELEEEDVPMTFVDQYARMLETWAVLTSGEEAAPPLTPAEAEAVMSSWARCDLTDAST